MTAKMNLSPAAQSLLLSTGTSRQGAKPTHRNPEALQELKDRGLIGTGGGLTRTGTIQRDLHNVIPF